MIYFKTITWRQYDDRKFVSNDYIPQIMYRIDMGWDNELDEPNCELRFYHGYVNVTPPIAKGTANYCKEFAQRHYEQYVRDSFFETNDGY